MKRVEGKAILVTGGGSGLGQASAVLCGTEGAHVVCADINMEAAAATATSITAAGGNATAVEVDVSDAESTVACSRYCLERFGRIDALMNFAGISGNGSATTVDRATWDRVLSINLTGVWLMCRAVLPTMAAQKSGSIINVASIAALGGVPATAPYAAAKAGVIGLTRNMAVDYAGDNIRTNVICPGTVPTPLTLAHYLRRGEITADAVEDGLRATHARYPLRRLGRPEEIAALALYLSSDESGFVTGAVIPIDGGVSATAWQVGQ